MLIAKLPALNRSAFGDERFGARNYRALLPNQSAAP
jgi:hypothetical protein|tara:strand:- start:682 stop:789 length:108 start_codon:yes stop_codon:yes gene_type:complete